MDAVVHTFNDARYPTTINRNNRHHTLSSDTSHTTCNFDNVCHRPDSTGRRISNQLLLPLANSTKLNWLSSSYNKSPALASTKIAIGSQ
mmetsp:Transcript_2959/g.5708  ORF Transcript_2959/g.5708 Transcript_2959/m.5708 type:complete len:89 (+) Transcript_2959:6367-6633(+)